MDTYSVGLSIAPFVPTPLATVRQILQLGELQPGELLYDLGCGDGRFPIIAAREFDARGVGVELRPSLIFEAEERLGEAETLCGRKLDVKFILGDMMDVPIQDAEVVVCYLNYTGNRMIQTKLETDLREGTRVIAPSFAFHGWTHYLEKHIRTAEAGRICRYYRIGEHL